MPGQSPNRIRKRTQRHGERGYILITIIFAFAVMAIVATMVAPAMIFELKRDREEEMIHRGVQYSRAVRNFVKKNGRYPMSLAELDNTSQIRYLRRHYKDPITGKDFKLLHQSDVPLLSSGPGIAGAIPPGGLNGVAGAQGVQQQAAAQIAQGLAAAQGSQSFGNSGASNSGNENNDQGFGPQISQADAGQTGGGDNSNGPATPPANGQPPQPGQNQAGGPTSLFGNSNGNQTFGGGPMVGVASISKDKSIRIFNKKDHYKDWQFIYDPSTDRGGLITGPAQPALQGTQGNLNGQQPNGQNGNSPNAFGPGGGGSGFNGPGSPGSGPGTNSGFQPPPPGNLPEQ
jgi:type II secretory pathway pseudopilin PulG